MFCPKCGSQNTDETKFCRGCGADLNNVLAIVDGKPLDVRVVSEKHIDLYSSGIRNLMLAIGFLIVSTLVYMIPGNTYFWLLILLPVFPLLASGVSRIIKAREIKALNKSEVIRQISLPANQSNPALPPLKGEYIKPLQSIYKTDDLAERPPSITEHTTHHLQIEPDGRTPTLPKT